MDSLEIFRKNKIEDYREIILCPNCFRVPFVELKMSKGIKNVKILCKFCGYKTTELSLSKYLEILYKLKREDIKCEKHNNESESFCFECKKNLCKYCLKEHCEKFDHNLIDSPKYLNIYTNCTEHSNNPYKYYCFNCNVNLCKKCNLKIHKTHNLIKLKFVDFFIEENKIKKHYNDLKNYINVELINKGNDYINYLKSKIELIEQLIENNKNFYLDFFNLWDILFNNYSSKYSNYYQINNLLSIFNYSLNKYTENSTLSDYDKFINYLNTDILTEKKEMENIPDNKILEYPPLSNNSELIVKPIINLNNGDFYFGEWNKNEKKIQGRGIYLWKDGKIYKGYWKDNKRNIRGRCRFSNNSIYEGEWRNDKKNGYGILVNNEGDIYCGYFLNDQRNGEGSYIWGNGKRYIGEFKDGVREGYGIFSYPNSDFYEGEFKNNYYNGFGIYKWNNGEIFEGIWKNHKKNGNGEFYNPKTNKWLKGLWIDNQLVNKYD